MFKATHKGKFVTFESVGLRLTKKQVREGRERFEKLESSLDKKFRHIRTPDRKKKMAKFDGVEV